eukprot:TRINITY_DN7576_c0_g3_i1.p2 TRINITY_DN7576_c0_g3~~TRINITY_DN7576_c0_g3_i1.p2  ORF type:complete len:223 (+),score=23.41 TRINITY_DN7576_c0_g3_i1:223-891(+)
MLVLLCTAALLLLFGNTESAVEIHKDNAEIRNYEASPEGTYIGLCLIAKNENKFLREWVDYHKYIGVGKFYIYDHNSTIPMNAIVEDYISSGLVLYKYLTDEWREDTYKLNEQWPDFGCEGIKVQRAHQPTSQCQGKKKKEEKMKTSYLCKTPIYLPFCRTSKIMAGCMFFGEFTGRLDTLNRLQGGSWKITQIVSISPEMLMIKQMLNIQQIRSIQMTHFA